MGMFIPWQKGSKVTPKTNPGLQMYLYIYMFNIFIYLYIHVRTCTSQVVSRKSALLCLFSYLDRFEGNGVNGVPWHGKSASVGVGWQKENSEAFDFLTEQ